jgi:hypothetical protein
MAKDKRTLAHAAKLDAAKATAERLDQIGRRVQAVGCLLTLLITIPLIVAIVIFAAS